MRLYEDDKEEIRPSFSFGDEKDNSLNVHEQGGGRYHEERSAITHDPVSKVQTKLNIVAIIIPCLVTIAILVMYFQIKNELTTIQNSGSTELKNLSLELQQKVTNVETKLAAIEQKINTDLEATSASVKDLNTKIQNKADKKDFDAFNTQASSKLEQIQKSASDTASATADKIKKDIEASVGQMQTSVNAAVKSVNDIEKSIKPEIESLKGSVSEATSLAKSAQKEAASVKASDFATSDDIRKETVRLEAKIKELEQKIAKQPKTAPIAPTSTSKSTRSIGAEPKPEPVTKHKTVKPAAPVPEEIFEEPPVTDMEEAPPAQKPSKSKGGINEQNL